MVVSAVLDHSRQRTEAGGPVVSFPVDPFMTAQQEGKIYQFMRRPCRFDWNGKTTLVDIQRDLAEHVAIEIDWRAFEEIGIDPKEAVYPDLAVEPERTAVPVPASNRDPFSPTAIATSEPSANDETNDPDRMWWRKHKMTISPSEVSTAARLLYFLDQLDSTITIRLGQLILTTQERAEQHCCVRIYDVTPIVTLQLPGQYLGRALNNGSSVDDQSLINMIQTAVDPDTWECMGGPSTMQVFACRDRQWLVTTVTLVRHWRIQELLNKINQ
jgi:hypothetical protein